MNRLEMAENIQKRVPTLAVFYKDELKRAEGLRAEFVADYPLKRIPNLSLDEYVIGKGSSNRSFCYRLEREMDSLGKILGATAYKFGIYFGKKNSSDNDSTKNYQFASRWGKNHDDAFVAVKQAIVDLLNAAAAGSWTSIAANSLSPMFKGKILFLYFPNQFAPIYSEEHLKHFVAQLNLSGAFECGADMQRALMEYRATWKELVEQPAALYMRLLYDIFGYPPDKQSAETILDDAPVLDDAIKGAQFISEMPETTIETKSASENQRKIDYEKQARRLKRIGDRGEMLVLVLERKRLIQAGRTDLAGDIKHTSQENDSAGYDILSFDEDGKSRPIEVKATTGKNLDRGFYLSYSELEKANDLPNYHLYIVFSALTKHPRILPLKHPALNGADFTLRPVTYHVTISESAPSA